MKPIYFWPFIGAMITPCITGFWAHLVLAWLCVPIGDEILPSYIGNIRSQHKDPDKPISIMEGNKSLEHCSFVSCGDSPGRS